MRDKGFIKNFVLNAIATGVPIVVLQLIIEPKMSKNMSGEEFGLLLAIFSLVNLLSGIFGSSLDNLLLINYKTYPDKRYDYNIIFIFSFAVNTILLVFLAWFYHGAFELGNIISAVVCGLLLTLFQYTSAEYRITLDYNKILICGLLKGIGYFIGYLVFLKTGYWYAVLLFSAVFETIFSVLTTDVIKYPYKKSKNMPILLKSYFLILGASAAAATVSYIDKLIIYPMFGGNETSIYNAATVLTKVIMMATGPMASVLLSYLIKKSSISLKKYNLICLLMVGSGIPLFVLMYYFCKIGLPILYPEFAVEAMVYVPYTSIFTLLTIFISFLKPLLLVRVGEGAVLIYEIIYLVFYVGLGVVGLVINNVLGFCISKCISYGAMALLLYLVLSRNIRLKKNKDDIRKYSEIEETK